MCGIAGRFGTGILGTDSVPCTIKDLRHRGPDGEGMWKSPGGDALFIHTRLAILELSESGCQPMCLGDRYWLVFNGEIYNHRELQTELEALGERFEGHSDTEVLLRLLAREGKEALPRLAGMFAFAFWDEKNRYGLLARDAFGIKPLYVDRRLSRGIAFASEWKVLVGRKGAIDLNPAATRDFFLWGSVSEPDSIQTGIEQIPAGHFLEWSGGTCGEAVRWYHLPRLRGKEAGKTRADDARGALEESIRRHLVSDVPIGVFLSGGIDSTVILALVRQVLGERADIRTFSIGFDDPEFDESGIARRTACHFGAIHTEWRMSEADGRAEIEPFLNAVDQPCTDGFNTWCVSKLASREGLKVVLSGLGGDEFFAGYSSFQRIPWLHRLHQLSRPLRRPLASVIARLSNPGSPWRRLGAFLEGGGSWLSAFHAQRGIFTEREARELTIAITGKDPGPAEWRDPPVIDREARAIVGDFELNRYMRNQLLRDSDIFSMAHGLELRVPFVDARFAETILSIPSQIRLAQGKRFLLEMVPEVPDWVRDQPKRGFRFPIQDWIKSDFGDLLRHAEELSPVELSTWYRLWAVAMVGRTLERSSF